MRLEHWLYTIPLRLRSLFRRAQIERELDEELRFHLEQRIEREIAAGKTPGEARHAALRAMEGVEQQKEQCRDTRKVNMIENLMQDVRYAWRSLFLGLVQGAWRPACHRTHIYAPRRSSRSASRSHHQLWIVAAKVWRSPRHPASPDPAGRRHLRHHRRHAARFWLSHSRS